MALTSANVDMDEQQGYEYPDPEVASTTWIPAYSTQSLEFEDDYYGSKLAQAMRAGRPNDAREHFITRAVQPIFSSARATSNRSDQITRPNYDPTHLNSTAPINTRTSVRRARPTNFPRELNDDASGLTLNVKPGNGRPLGLTRLPRSHGSMDLRDLVIDPAMRSAPPSTIPQYTAQPAAAIGVSQPEPIDTSTDAPEVGIASPAVPEDNAKDDNLSSRSRGQPGRKRKGLEDSDEIGPNSKRVRMPKVVTNTFTTLPVHAPQATAAQLGGPAVPPGIRTDELFQGGKGRAESTSDNYGELLRGRIPINAQMSLGTVFTVEELAAFHPQSFQFPEVAKRMIRNKITSQDIARMQLEAVGEMSEDNLKTLDNRLKYQYTKGGKLAYPAKFAANGSKFNKRLIEVEGPHTDLTADQWRFRSEYTHTRRDQESFGHVKLEAIHGPVPAANRPTGQGCGKLSAYLTFAEQYDAAHLAAKLDTSHWGWIATQVNAQDPQLSAGFATLDHEVTDRLRAVWNA